MIRNIPKLWISLDIYRTHDNKRVFFHCYTNQDAAIKIFGFNIIWWDNLTIELDLIIIHLELNILYRRLYELRRTDADK
jgi:hypothetical protein